MHHKTTQSRKSQQDVPFFIRTKCFWVILNDWGHSWDDYRPAPEVRYRPPTPAPLALREGGPSGSRRGTPPGLYIYDKYLSRR